MFYFPLIRSLKYQHTGLWGLCGLMPFSCSSVTKSCGFLFEIQKGCKQDTTECMWDNWLIGGQQLWQNTDGEKTHKQTRWIIRQCYIYSLDPEAQKTALYIITNSLGRLLHMPSKWDCVICKRGNNTFFLDEVKLVQYTQRVLMPQT